MEFAGAWLAFINNGEHFSIIFGIPLLSNQIQRERLSIENAVVYQNKMKKYFVKNNKLKYLFLTDTFFLIVNAFIYFSRKNETLEKHSVGSIRLQFLSMFVIAVSYSSVYFSLFPIFNNHLIFFHLEQLSTTTFPFNLSSNHSLTLLQIAHKIRTHVG